MKIFKILPVKNPVKQSVGLLVGIILFFVFFTLPVYILPSGSAQVVDLFILILIASIVFRQDGFDIYYIKQIVYLLPFAIWVILVNLSYFTFNYEDYSLLKKAVEMLYIFLLLYTFLIIFKDSSSGKQFRYVYLGVIFSLILIFLLKGENATRELRMALSFNNPNQMGYFAVLLMSFVVLLKNIEINGSCIKNRKMHILFITLIVVVSHLLALLSVSKAAIGAIFIIDLFLLRKFSIKMIASCLGVFIIMLMAMLFYKPDFFDKLITYIELRAKVSTVSERFDKNADRLQFDKDWQFIVGMGSGKEERNVDELEIHNTWGSILKCYGLIGVIFSTIWFLRLCWLSRSINGGLFIFTALIFYNMFHNGFRFRFFWIITAFFIISANLLTRREPKVIPLNQFPVGGDFYVSPQK